jgi:DNA (cytosine-5)-methyltransferase 1
VQEGQFNSISLFTGAGGLDIGLEQAGFCTLFAVDSGEDAVCTLQINRQAQIPIGNGRTFLQETVILPPGGIEAVTAEHLRCMGVGPSWVPDLMAGGPPCQPFSSSGKMLSLEDPRGRLFEHFVRLAAALRPKLILFENVRGLVTARGPRGEPGEAIFLVKEAFERIGYGTTFALLNAADHGVPQRRVRCFMMASQCTELPLFPEPTHAETPTASLFDRRLPWVSLGALLETLPPPPEEEVVCPTPRLAEQLGKIADGSGLKSAGAREATRPGGHWGYRQGTFIADLKQPARTITASASQDWIRLSSGSLRRLTLRECAAIQGFPLEWQFAGTQASRFRLVGNAVPVTFGRVLGEALITVLRGGKRTRPQSASFPSEFLSAIAYTRREQTRNGESRVEARRKVRNGFTNLAEIKGLGSADAVSPQGP